MDLAAELSEDDEQTWLTVKLTMYNKAILASPKSWLDDLIITNVQYMLKQQHPFIDGFQPPALSQDLSKIPPLEQIVNVNKISIHCWLPKSMHQNL